MMNHFGITMSEIIDKCKISLHTSKADRIKTSEKKNK